MNVTCCFGTLGVLLALLSHVVAQQDHPSAVRFVRQQGELFLSAVDVAARLDLELKFVVPDRMVTFCREGDGGFCIPVRLTPDNHRGADADLLLNADLLCNALACRVVETGAKVAIEPHAVGHSSKANLAATGYNTTWPAGRGFQPGETLPDIPLVDLRGNEVRFSQFLGKRYILYCWASW